MWRFVLPGAGVVGMTLLLLAGSLASWTFGDAVSSGPSASSTVAAAPPTPARPAPTPASEEDAMKLALAALASVPSSSAPTGSAGVALPPGEPVPPTPSAPIAPRQPSALAVPLASTESPPAPPPPSPPTPASPATLATPSPPSPRLLSPPSAPGATPLAPTPGPVASDDATDQVAANASPSDQADQDSFASVESLIHRLRTAHRRDAMRTTSTAPAPAYRAPPSERLATARTLLASGQTDQARPLLEAAAAQLLLGSGEAYPSGTSAAARVDDALRWLSAGQPARALGLVDAAITVLDQGRGASAVRTDRRVATQVPASGPESGLW